MAKHQDCIHLHSKKVLKQTVATPMRKRSRTKCQAALKSPSVDAASVFKTDQRPIVLFDGVCNL